MVQTSGFKQGGRKEIYSGSCFDRGSRFRFGSDRKVTANTLLGGENARHSPRIHTYKKRGPLRTAETRVTAAAVLSSQRPRQPHRMGGVAWSRALVAEGVDSGRPLFCRMQMRRGSCVPLVKYLVTVQTGHPSCRYSSHVDPCLCMYLYAVRI